MLLIRAHRCLRRLSHFAPISQSCRCWRRYECLKWVDTCPWHPGFPPSAVRSLNGPSSTLPRFRADGRDVPIPCRELRCSTECYSITSSARARSVGGTSRPSAFATIRLTTRSNLVGCSTGRSAGFAPAKSCRPSRRRAAEVDEGHRADGGREFLFFVADVPDADYLARCVLDAARHIGGYADIIITRLYEKRSRAAGLSLDLVDNREVVVHLG